MKKSRICFVLSILFILSFKQITAQNATYNTGSGLTIGFGAGASFQQSDIANSMGTGLDLSLGSSLYSKEGSFLALDWKFRFLAGENKAWDHNQNTDNTYSNLRYNFFSYDLELGLTLNRLRERTGIIFSGFVGAGVSHGLTSTDLLDPDNLAYDFSGIDPLAQRSKIVDDLKNLSDGSFETKLNNKAALLPTAGIFLGYQFSPRFSLGIGHKVNFSLSEDNSFTGLDIDSKVIDGSTMDMNHYTSIGFRWKFGSAKSRSVNVSPRPSTAVRTTPERISAIPAAAPKMPEVDITIPYRDPFISSSKKVDVTARYMRIAKKEDVSVELDGKKAAFDFLPEYKKIELVVDMLNDTCVLSISAKNNEGSASDQIVLIYREDGNISRPAVSNIQGAVSLPARTSQLTRVNEVTRANEATRVKQELTGTNQNSRQNRANRTQNTTIQRENTQLPQISFINPPRPLTVDKNIFSLKARALNVKEWQDIKVLVNGAENNFFSYAGDGTISLNIGLKEGLNEVLVSGTNSSGTAQEKTSITYKKTIIVPDPIQTTDIISTGNVIPVTDTVQAVVVTPVTDTVQTIVVTPVTDTVQAVVVTPVTDTVQTVVVTPVTEITPVTSVTNTTEQKPVGVRINPGNSDWQFCLLTPSGTYNRSDLKNANFSYSGPATGIYFKPIGGGGYAIVKGEVFNLSPGKDYLFKGNLVVSVSTSNPGSMGHWSICIEADREPVSGNGKNRPTSPCEEAGGRK